MKRFSKKSAIIICVIALVTVIIGGIYWYIHPTHYLYNDRWIIGRNVYQIKERYGEYDKHFDRTDGGFRKGYCTKPETYDPLFGDTIWAEYYLIDFDENGIAFNVKMEEGGWGG